jgi:glycosidase
MTSPGAPSVYYGSEVGLTGGRDPENRKGFDWSEASWDQSILEAHRALIQLRNDYQALRTGTFRTYPSGPDLYVAEREDEAARILIVVNASRVAQSASIADFAGTSFTTLYGEGGITSDGSTVRVALAPRTAVVWKVTA